MISCVNLFSEIWSFTNPCKNLIMWVFFPKSKHGSLVCLAGKRFHLPPQAKCHVLMWRYAWFTQNIWPEEIAQVQPHQIPHIVGTVCAFQRRGRVWDDWGKKNTHFLSSENVRANCSWKAEWNWESGDIIQSTPEWSVQVVQVCCYK